MKEAQLTIGAEELPQSKQAKKGEIDVMPQAPKNTKKDCQQDPFRVELIQSDLITVVNPNQCGQQ